MNYSAEIRSLMAEEHKLHDAAEARKQASGRDREYLLLRIERDQIAYQGDELRRQAAEAFAALNGWQQSRSRFRVKTLLRGGVHDGYARSAYDDDAIVDPISIIDLFDHAVFFREIARPTARLPSSASPIRGDDPDAWQFNREPDDAAARHDPAAPEAPQDAPPPLMPCAHCGRTDSGVYQMKDIRFFDPLNPPPGEEPMFYLREGCTQAFFANGTAEPGLSPGRIRELAAWYLARATAQHEANEAGDISSAELDADLRLILREEVFPEFVEMEFGRVMKAVFSEIA